MLFVEDQMGRCISIPDFPKRIISLVPSQTELLSYLGLDEQLVGITKFCVHPIHVFKSKTRVGGTKQYHIDRIHSLKPDLIIANKEENDRAQIEILNKDYPVWISDIKTIDDALDMIERIGILTNTSEKANELIRDINSEQIVFEKERKGLQKLKVVYLIWKNPWMAVGNNTFIQTLLQEAGFINQLNTSDRYPEISLTDLNALKPDVVLLSSEPFPFKEQDILEVRNYCPNAKILLVDGEMFSWYGNRLLKSFNYFRELWRKL